MEITGKKEKVLNNSVETVIWANWNRAKDTYWLDFEVWFMDGLVWFQAFDSVQKCWISQIKVGIWYVHWSTWRMIHSVIISMINQLFVFCSPAVAPNQWDTYCIDMGLCFATLLRPYNLPCRSMNYLDLFQNRHRHLRECYSNQLEYL